MPLIFELEKEYEQFLKGLLWDIKTKIKKRRKSEEQEIEKTEEH